MAAGSGVGGLRKHLRASDLRGVARLATQATLGVACISEGVHQSVLRGLGARPGAQTDLQTSGITGLVYASVRGITRQVGAGLDRALGKLQPLFELADQAAPESFEREAVLAAINGVMGDRLAADGNPLATPMRLRVRPSEGNDSAPTGKLILLVHGLCMNDLQWTKPQGPARAGGEIVFHDHGVELARALSGTAVYARYNSGLHVSENGHELARQLERLVAYWPTSVTKVTVVAHSMGGLVIRSALHSAAQNRLAWPALLKNIVFLGTPHHGAPLERAGNWIDVILGSTRWTQPFARLGQLRSSGITDLRFGHVLDADWQGHDRFRRKPDSRTPLPLPEGIACFTVAATLGTRRGALTDRLMGDGLVPLQSALGQHDKPEHQLAFHKSSQHIAYETGHLQLLSSPQVTQKLVTWLGS